MTVVDRASLPHGPAGDVAGLLVQAQVTWQPTLLDCIGVYLLSSVMGLIGRIMTLSDRACGTFHDTVGAASTVAVGSGVAVDGASIVTLESSNS